MWFRTIFGLIKNIFGFSVLQNLFKSSEKEIYQNSAQVHLFVTFLKPKLNT